MKILFLGVTRFPMGEASSQKAIYICKSLSHAGVDITMVCKKSVLPQNIEFESEGHYEGFSFIFTTGTPYKSNKFIVRNYNKIKGFVNEFRFVLKSRRESKIDAAIIYTRSFLNVVLYKLYSRIFSFKVIVNYGELRSKINFSKISFGLRMNDYFFDKYVFLFADGFLPISNYLIDYIKEKKQNIPFLKTPPLCDYSLFENHKEKPGNDFHFLYCGSLGYFEIAKFILDAFNKMQKNEFSLYLIIHGNSERMTRLKNYIKENFEDPKKIKIFSGLPYNDLVSFYNNAYALLIPLRPSIQDMARFPHKIGEYCATGRPIITTEIGEVKHYFKDKESAFVSSEYNVHLFADKMIEASSNPELAKMIGQEGRRIGLEHFDYKAYGKKLKQFVSSINS
jgi:glycosyltransferase involved in cell wall biosynthesis